MGNPVALAKAMRLVLTGQAGAMAKGAAANTVIDLGPLIPPWAMGTHAIGDVRMHSGVPWRCCQTHNSVGNPGWYPGAVAALWAPYHATDAAHALPWITPTGAQDAYQAGECMVWSDGKIYRCKVANTVHDPAAYAPAWEVMEK